MDERIRPLVRRWAKTERLDTLVGVLPTKRDLNILLRAGWYRIPMDSVPKRGWPPKTIAFYEGVRLRDDPGIHRFASVLSVEERTREELFPGEPAGRRTDKHYAVLRLGPIEARKAPIILRRPRPVVFITTSARRFERAQTINDLFADSPLEDELWTWLKDLGIPAERQWQEKCCRRRYLLDFAIFCREGKIDLETDGDTYHIGKEAGAKDNLRNNHLTECGWSNLRFETAKILDRIGESLAQVSSLIELLGGLADGQIPDRIVSKGATVSRQMSFWCEL